MASFVIRHKRTAILALIFILGILIYSNTWNASFQFDDRDHILSNWSIHNISDIPTIWKLNFKTRFLPTLSLAFNLFLTGSDVFSYHLFNLGIHLFNAFWVYCLVLLICATPKMQQSFSRETVYDLACFSALVFLCHPLQTQAVTYIIQRLASMVTFFYLGAIVFYLRGRIEKRAVDYGLAFGMTIAAMLCKENAFTLPLAIVLVEILFFETQEKRKTLFRLLPFLLTLVITPFLIHSNSNANPALHQFIPNALIKNNAFSRGEYFLTEINVLCTYLRLFLFPIHQNLDYDYPISHSLLEPKTFLCFLLLTGLLAAGIWMLKKNRLVTFSIFWFFLTLSVESTFIPLDDVIFEHRMYLPLAGLAILLAFVLHRFLRRRSHFMIAGTLVILTLSCMTYARNNVWKDEISLWSDTIHKSPHKARGYGNLGFAYAERGEQQKAYDLYEKSIQIDPLYANSYYHLGLYYAQKNDWQKAIALYQKTIALDPQHCQAYNNLGTYYARIKDMDRAADALEKAILSNPSYVVGYDNLGVIYHDKGDIEKAIKTFQKAIEINPAYAPPYLRLGLILKDYGDWKNSADLFQHSSHLDPLYADPVFALGQLYLETGDLKAAKIQVGKLKTLNRSDMAQYLERKIAEHTAAPQKPRAP